MMIDRIHGTVAFVWVLALAGLAHGAGYAVVEQSAVAGGTGGAGAARSSDPAAAWFCPAAAARSQGLAASAGLMVLVPGIQASSLEGADWSQGLTTGPRLPPHAYLSYTHGPFAGGLAFNVPFGTSVRWPMDWQGRYQAVTSQLQVFRLAPFVAWSFGPLRVGAGLHVDTATLQVKRRLDFVDTDGTMALSLADVGLGGHASLHVDLGSMVSVGASYKSRTRLALEGTARFDAPLSFVDKARDGRARARYTLPDLVVVGAEVRPHRRVTVALDLGVTVWSVYDAFSVDFEHDGTPDVSQPQRWETRVSVRGGVEYRPLDWLALRLGLLYDPTPVPGETLAPTSPDSDRVGGTAGLGVDLPWLPGLSADAFYGHVHMLGQEALDAENLRARYAGRMQLAGFGLRYRHGRF